jgi:hypothetical protein
MHGMMLELQKSPADFPPLTPLPTLLAAVQVLLFLGPASTASAKLSKKRPFLTFLQPFASTRTGRCAKKMIQARINVRERHPYAMNFLRL